MTDTPQLADTAPKPEVLLAEKRGFCFGVKRSIDIVNQTISNNSENAPIYVYHEIVHNKIVVERFQDKGVVFINDLSEIAQNGAKNAQNTVIFSAHGVSPALRACAQQTGSKVVDATCPLVSRVHERVRHYMEQGYQILYIGHKGHDEVVGVLGEGFQPPPSLVIARSRRRRGNPEKTDKNFPFPSLRGARRATRQPNDDTVMDCHGFYEPSQRRRGSTAINISMTSGIIPPIILIDNIDAARNITQCSEYNATAPKVWLSQTTLSVYETRDIIAELKRNIPNLEDPLSECICSATTQRQNAVTDLAEKVGDGGLIIVVGSKNSSNTQRLADLAGNSLLTGVSNDVIQVDCAAELDLEKVRNYPKIGITAGASVPDDVTDEITRRCEERSDEAIQ